MTDRASRKKGRRTGQGEDARAVETPVQADMPPVDAPTPEDTPPVADQPAAPREQEDPEAPVFTLHDIAEDFSPPKPSEPSLPADPSANGAGSPPPVPPPAGAESGVPRENRGEDTDGEQTAEKSMTLLDHLGELRARLVRGFAAVLIAFCGCYGFAGDLFHALALPLLKVMPADSKFIYTGVAEGFFVDLKVSFVAALFAASPFLFYQIWAFIAPGLYDEEKRHAIPLALCSAVFFIGGASFCYLVVFPFAFTFFLSYSTDNIVAMLSINEYLSFSLKMLIAFGLIFEMPLFAFFLARMGLLTARKMRRARKYAVLGVFIVAAILTPPDVFSQILMALPMLLLYEVSILVAAAAGGRDKGTKKDKEKKDKEMKEAHASQS